VLGVDTSQKMIERARNLNPNCRFEFNPYPDLRLIPSAQFQLVYCRRVLQHQPSASDILGYIAEFLRVLKPAGILAFQIPARIPLLNRIQPRRRLYTLFRSLGVDPVVLYRRGLYPVAMTAVSDQDVISVLRGANGHVLSIEPDTVSCPGIPSNFFYVTK
jgi:SAM-dependent methyltransferase